MNLFLPKNTKHKLEQQKQLELDRRKNWFIGLSNKLVDFCKEENLTVSDFEMLVEITKDRFKLRFGKVKIEDFKEKIK